MTNSMHFYLWLYWHWKYFCREKTNGLLNTIETDGCLHYWAMACVFGLILAAIDFIMYIIPQTG